jgi:hypothetical protein
MSKNNPLVVSETRVLYGARMWTHHAVMTDNPDAVWRSLAVHCVARLRTRQSARLSFDDTKLFERAERLLRVLDAR